MSEANCHEEFYPDEIDIRAILEEYHRKQLLENLCGPAVSLATHLVVLSLMFIYVVTQAAPAPPTIEVSIVEEKVIEIEKEFVHEIDPEDPKTSMEDQTTPVDVQAPDDSSTAQGEENLVETITDEPPSTAQDMDDYQVIDTVNQKSPLVINLGGGMGNRGKPGETVKKYRGDPRGPNAIRKTLAWLVKVQNTDGSWGTAGEKAAYTGMALLVFLAHGETPLSKEYGETVENAMRWLTAAVMNSKDGKLGRAYSHGIATYALSESYAMTRIPFLRSAMERAVAVIIYGQQQGGGFDYNYKKDERWDNSVSGWQFQALKAAYVAGASNEGLEDAIRKAVAFERRTAYAGGKFGYASAGSGGNMTGVGTVTLQLLGAAKVPECRKGIETIGTERLKKYQEVIDDPRKWDEVAGACMYGWYYDTQAMFNSQADSTIQNKYWKDWQRAFEKVLLRHQQPEGYWEVAKGHGMGPDLNGRILATCWSALQLEVYYRYLPTFDINKMDQHVVRTDALEMGDGELIINIE